MKFDKATASSRSRLISFIEEKRKEKQFQQTAELSFTFIFICFFLFFAIRPTVLTISNLVGEIKAKKVMSLDLKNQINSIIQAQTVYGQIQSSYDLIDSCLPERYAFSHASNQIVGMSDQSGLRTNELSFGLTNDRDTKTPYFSYSLSTPIDYMSLNTLVKNINTNIRLININTMTIMPYSDKDDQTQTDYDPNKVNLNLTTQIFYLPK